MSEDRPALAAILMVGSLCMLSLQDSLIKLASADVSLWQFQTLRAVCNLAMLFVLARFIWGSGSAWPKRFSAVALRSCFLIGAMLSFFGAIPVLRLSEVAAGLYVFPLFVAVLSALVLGPGNIDQAHQPDEYLELNRIEPTLDLLRKFMYEFCINV